MIVELPLSYLRWFSRTGLIIALTFLAACNSGSSNDGNSTPTVDKGTTNNTGTNTSDAPGGGTGTSSNSGGSTSATGSPGSTGSGSGSSDSGSSGSSSSGSGSTGSGSTGSGTAGTNVAVACTSSGDDSTQNADGSASFVRSNTVGSPLYHIVLSRKDYLNRDIWLDYMVHEPTGTPTGIVVLIAGGAMNAAIYGTEGGTATHSGENYLVRSAHRYMQAGYRVITMDRPSDYAKYGDIDNAGYLYDVYRTSVDHAVDITTIVNRENSEDLPVFIAGTSRGAISAVAQNMLAAGIDISSPVTVASASGTAVGTNTLPVTLVQVPVHLLYHQNDACDKSPEVKSASLFDQFVNAGIEVSGNNVSGGFYVSTVPRDVCGALDYHGYTGIENCAVNTSTTWMDNERDVMEIQHPGNVRPVAQGQTVSDMMGQAIDITLTATDSDDTTLSYDLPYKTSSLGGSLTITGNIAHYVAPDNNLSASTTDSLVFTVTDSKGSRSAAVVKVELSQALVDHSSPTLAACSTCHSLPLVAHIATTLECNICHLTSQWTAGTFDHTASNITIGSGNCSICHDGIRAAGKSTSHIDTKQECDVCHVSTSDWLTLTTSP